MILLCTFFLVLWQPPSLAGTPDEDSRREREIRRALEELAKTYEWELGEGSEGFEIKDPKRVSDNSDRIASNKLRVRQVLSDKNYQPSKEYKEKVAALRSWLWWGGTTSSVYDLDDLMEAVLKHSDFRWTGGVKAALFQAARAEADLGSVGIGTISLIKELPQKEVTPGVVETFLYILKKKTSLNETLMEYILKRVNCSENHRLDGGRPLFESSCNLSLPINPGTHYEKIEPIVLISRLRGKLGEEAKKALIRTGLL